MCECTEPTTTVLASWHDEEFRYLFTETMQICCQMIQQEWFCVALFSIALLVLSVRPGRGPYEP